MKRRSAALAGVLSGLFLSAASPDEPSCKRVARPDFSWSRCAQDRIWVIEARKGLDLFHAAEAVPTLRQWSGRLPAHWLLLNGSYHDGDYARPTMVGLLRIAGRRISPLKPGDPQLSRVIELDERGRIVRMREASEAAGAAAGSEMQTGSAILVDGEVAAAEIAASANGSDQYKRTALGLTSTGEVVIVIARTPRSLPELGRIVQRLNGYAGRRLTLVNLDGGPSTAIHAPRVRGLSYGADKVTPIVIGVRR